MMKPVDYDPFAGGEIRSSHETTESQKELWLAAQISREANCSYNLSVRLHFKHGLDTDRFKRALELTAANHDSLRMTFSRDGAYYSISAEPVIDFEIFDGADAAAVERLLASEAEEPFDLAEGPLWRCKLARQETACSVLITTHHLAADGWSTGLVLQDVAEAYSDESSIAVRSPDQFADYSRWLDSKAISEQAEADLQYWRERFADHVSSPSLPSRRERVAMHDFKCHFLAHGLSRELVNQLRTFAKSSRVTFSTLLTTAFGAYLGAITGRKEVVLGVPSAGQLDSGMDGLVGHCVNTLPVKIELDPALGFAALLSQVRNTLLDDLEHRKVTFGTLLKSGRGLRDQIDGPLVPLMFNVESGGLELDFDKARPEISFIPRRYDYFDATFNCTVEDDGLVIDVHFNAALYGPDDMRNRLAEFEAFLDRVTGAAAVDAISTIPLTSGNQQTMLDRFNATDASFGELIDIPALVRSHATTSPDRVAFIYRDTNLTYRELDRQSDKLAFELCARNVDPGDLVAIMIPPSTDMILSLLAVLKTGAGYLPIDPELPENRIASILENAQVKTIVCTSVVRDRASRCSLEPLLFEDLITSECEGFACPGIEAEHLAYVIYTSGSTGEPKGVEITHGALWNLLNSLKAEPGFVPTDRFIGLTTLSFDIAVLEIWLPIFLGASSVIVDKRDAQDGRAISRLIDRHGVTVVQATPSSWNLLLASNWQGSERIKAIAGGEPLRLELIEQVLPRVGELWNGYGPTEATVYTLFKKIEPGQAVTVGRPVANTRVHIVGESDSLLPPGVTGEICISGPCLARGYRGRPEQTNSKFRIHPAIRDRAYHTGDLGYFDAERGEIVCLGRKDDQVKLRGYRIELGEISTTFAKSFAVKQAIAFVVGRGDTETIALAYRNENDQTIEIARAREVLREFLPDYMLPTRLHAVEQFAVTPNGKIDKDHTLREIEQSAEPAPAATDDDAVSRDEYTELQELALGIFREVLQSPGLSLRDNFFDAGGHSLLAMNTVIKLGDRLDIEIELVQLFDYPVIGEFIEQLESRLAGDLSAVAMESFYFGGEEQRLYGVLHKAAGRNKRKKSVLLLYPVGQEYMRIHRAYRRLADYLAESGFDVLRFDYACTGNSAGEFGQATLDDWVRSAECAFDHLREIAGGQEIDVVALRLGTVVARHLALSRNISRLVLWEPSFTDNYYLRQMLGSIRASGPTRSNFIENDVIHFNGFAYSPGIRDALANGDWQVVPETVVDRAFVISTREPVEFEGLSTLFGKSDGFEIRKVSGPDDWLAVDSVGGIILPEPSINGIRQWLTT